MLRGVDLTDAQREQIRAIVTEQRTGEDSMRKLGELRRELHTAIFADTPDPARIEQLKGAIVEAEAAALAARIEHQLKIAQVLTPDQRAKVREMPGPGPRGRGARP
jgi:Spy/CpxP family protein refolding chaperone